MPIAVTNRQHMCDACGSACTLTEARLVCDNCKREIVLTLPTELDNINVNWPDCHDEFMSLAQIGKCVICGQETSEVLPNGRLPLDCIPGTYEKRVFIGGNYDQMVALRNTKSAVLALQAGFVPILPYDDFQIPEDRIYEWDLRLLHSCKYAIFEVSIPAGELFEIARCAEFGVNTLLIYQARGATTSPPRARTMLLQSGNHEHHSYGNTTQLEQIVKAFLLEKSTSIWKQALEVFGYKFKEYEIYNRIYLNGEAEHKRSYRGLKVEIPHLKKSEMTHHFKITSGHIIDGSFTLDNAPSGAIWCKDNTKSNERVEAGVVQFNPPLTRESNHIDYSYSLKTKDAYILTKDKYNQLPPEEMDDPFLAAGNEYASFNVSYPLDVLKLCVEFPDGYKVNPKPMILFGTEQRNDDLRMPPDSFSFDGKFAIFSVSKPQIHYTYAVAWEIPDGLA